MAIVAILAAVIAISVAIAAAYSIGHERGYEDGTDDELWVEFQLMHAEASEVREIARGLQDRLDALVEWVESE